MGCSDVRGIQSVNWIQPRIWNPDPTPDRHRHFLDRDLLRRPLETSQRATRILRVDGAKKVGATIPLEVREGTWAKAE